MRFFVSKRLPFGLRAGLSIPVGQTYARVRQTMEPIGGAFVYVIKGAHNLTKVGISTNPIARIAQLQTASPFPMEFAYIGATSTNGAEIEAEAHRILGRYRTSGEWFDASPELAIAAVNGAAAKLSQSLIPVAPDKVLDVIRTTTFEPPSVPGLLQYPVMTWVIFSVACIALWALATILTAAAGLVIHTLLLNGNAHNLLWVKQAPITGFFLAFWIAKSKQR